MGSILNTSSALGISQTWFKAWLCFCWEDGPGQSTLPLLPSGCSSVMWLQQYPSHEVLQALNKLVSTHLLERAGLGHGEHPQV